MFELNLGHGLEKLWASIPRHKCFTVISCPSPIRSPPQGSKLTHSSTQVLSPPTSMAPGPPLICLPPLILPAGVPLSPAPPRIRWSCPSAPPLTRLLAITDWPWAILQPLGLSYSLTPGVQVGKYTICQASSYRGVYHLSPCQATNCFDDHISSPVELMNGAIHEQGEDSM